MYDHITPWNFLPKRQIWAQLGLVENQRILDFGSGEGVTANYLAEHNEVVAVEPSREMLQNRMDHHAFEQIAGDIGAIQAMGDETFDIIICHNVLEYVPDRVPIYREFERLLRPDGTLSLVKHNPFGRVMQMAILLNDFQHAHNLLDGANGASQQAETIRYYPDEEILDHTANLRLEEVYGARTFWHLQQNQEIHQNAAWQDKMLELEARVSQMAEFRTIAFFHHLVLRKRRSS